MKFSASSFSLRFYYRETSEHYQNVLRNISKMRMFILFLLFFLRLHRGSCYSLLKHNCNTFSEDLCQFLCGASIPKYILDLPQEFLSTPLGQSLGPLIGMIHCHKHHLTVVNISLFSIHRKLRSKNRRIFEFLF